MLITHIHFFYIITFTALSLIGCKPEPASQIDGADSPERTAYEKAIIRTTFEAYRDALLEKDGARAVELVDSNTINYYSDMLLLARTATTEKTRSLSTVNKLMVLRLRHQFSADEIRSMDGRKLFIHGVKAGWIDADSVVRNSIGEVFIKSSTATAQQINQGRPVPLNWTFTKESDTWRINLAELMPMADQAFKQLLRENGMDEDEFLFSILESISGSRPNNEVWQPLE